MSGPGWVPSVDRNGQPCETYTGCPQEFPPHELRGWDQDSIGQWAKETFPGGDDDSPAHALRVLDEVIELCRDAGASWVEIRGRIDDASTSAAKKHPDQDQRNVGYPDPPAVPGEIADVAISLDVLASRRKVNRKREVDKKMIVNAFEREWISFGDGTGKHKKDGA